MNLSEGDLKLLRRLVELPESERKNTDAILPGYAQLKARGYAKTTSADGGIVTEITARGRGALAAHEKRSKL
jgi:hypothetical protein